LPPNQRTAGTTRGDPTPRTRCGGGVGSAAVVPKEGESAGWAAIRGNPSVIVRKDSTQQDYI